MLTCRNNEHPFSTDKDISSESFWNKTFEERDETFAWLRRNAPVSWHPPRETPDVPREVHGEAGFWAIVCNEDIAYVSLNYELFSSDQDKWGPVSFRALNPALYRRPNFFNMDPPRHTRYRQAIGAAFTPKAVKQLRDKIEQRSEQIVNRVIGAGEIDFVEEVSSRLPMLTVADMVGVPDSLAEQFALAGNQLVGRRDPEFLPKGMTTAEFEMMHRQVLREIGVDLVNHRRKHPADDVATALANVEVDGKPLNEDDIESVILLLAVAGNDTTKQTTTRTVIALAQNPDQRDWLMEDFDRRIGGAIEEFVRYATPVLAFARTATQDIELRGQTIERGDKVVMFYGSGNRDETVFPDPHRFDLTRGRKPHVAFGGGGVHYCLGNFVAKDQLRALFWNILTKLPDIEVGEPVRLLSDSIEGVKHLPVRIP